MIPDKNREAESAEKWQTAIETHGFYASNLLHPECIQKHAATQFVRIINKWANAVKPRDGQSKILEAGCGYGLDSLALASLGHHVTLLDSENIVLENVKKLIGGISKESAHWIVETWHQRIEDLGPFNNKQFNVVFNHGVLEHWMDFQTRKLMLEKLASVVAQNGVLIVAVPNALNPLFRLTPLDPNTTPFYRFSWQSFINELKTCGFSIQEFGGLEPGLEFGQWLKFRWMEKLIRFACACFQIMPPVVKRNFGAHVYAVLRKKA